MTAPDQSTAPALTLTGGGETVELSMKDIEALPALTGWAGVKTKSEKLLGPDEYTGVSLSEVAALVGGLDVGAGLVVEASDGYKVEFTESQLRGEGFTVYDPESGAEVAATQPLTPMLAYARAGEPLGDARGGQLVVQISQPEAAQLVDASWAVSDVVAVEVIAP